MRASERSTRGGGSLGWRPPIPKIWSTVTVSDVLERLPATTDPADCRRGDSP